MLPSTNKSTAIWAACQKKLDMDFYRPASVTVGMTDDDDLIARLCARAGMLMEDASVLAVLTSGQEPNVRTATLIDLAHGAHVMTALISAALALDQEVKRPRPRWGPEATQR